MSSGGCDWVCMGMLSPFPFIPFIPFMVMWDGSLVSGGVGGDDVGGCEVGSDGCACGGCVGSVRLLTSGDARTSTR